MYGNDSVPIPFFPNSMPFIIALSLSAASTLFILLVMLKTRLYKDPLARMVFGIIFVDLIFCLPKLIALIDFQKSYAICNIMQGIAHFGLISSFLWTACFAHGILVAVKFKDIAILSSYFNYYMLFSILIPLIDTGISMSTHYISYLKETNTCVHYAVEDKVDYGYLLYTGLPLLFSCCASALCYILIICGLRQVLPDAPASGMISLIVFPLISLICWGPTLAIDILVNIGVDVGASLTTTFQVIGHLQGLLDALFYGGRNGKIKESLKNVFNCKKQKPEETIVSSGQTQSLIQP